jgi:hypothetical protein
MEKTAPAQTIPSAEEVPVLDVPDAGRLAFHLGRAASYQAAARGDLPTIRCGRRIVVPTAQLRQLLGLDAG